jgi:hypothetical protein
MSVITKIPWRRRLPGRDLERRAENLRTHKLGHGCLLVALFAGQLNLSEPKACKARPAKEQVVVGR